MGQRRSKLDRHAAELIALRRAGATLAQATRWLRFPRLAVSCIDEVGFHILRLRAEGASIGECQRSLRHDHGLRVDRSTVSRWLRKHRDGEFAGRDGVVYTVVGKGGLVREVMLPRRLAVRLEERRLDAPALVVDRGVRYPQRYDVGGGQAFSASFSRASIEVLGTSRGAHGLRYYYAQERMRELMHHVEHRLALAIVSEELGHLRASITTRYLI